MLQLVQLLSSVQQISPYTCANTSILILPCLLSPLICKISGLRLALKTYCSSVFPRDYLAITRSRHMPFFLGMSVPKVQIYSSGKTAFRKLNHCYISQWWRQKKMPEIRSNALMCSAGDIYDLSYKSPLFVLSISCECGHSSARGWDHRANTGLHSWRTPCRSICTDLIYHAFVLLTHQHQTRGTALRNHSNKEKYDSSAFGGKEKTQH